MALGPDGGRKARERVAAEAEARIDRAIKGHRGKRVTISTGILGIDSDIWNSILGPRYRAAGWSKADWVSDQRDGDFIDLEP